jgi:hypothetical protein
MTLTLTSIYLIPPVAAICIRQLGPDPILRLDRLRENNPLLRFQQISIIGLLLLFGASYSYHAAMILMIFGTLFIFRYLSGKVTHKFALPSALSFVSLGFLMASIPALLAVYSATGTNYLSGRSWTASFHLTGYPFQFFFPYSNTMVDRLLTGLFSWYTPKLAAVRVIPAEGYFGEGEIYAISLFLVIPAIAIYFIIKSQESRRDIESLKQKKNSKIDNLPRDQHSSVIFLAIFFTFLWSVVGGLGSMFSLFVSPILRGYSRFMVLVPVLIVFVIGLYFTELRKQLGPVARGKWNYIKSHRRSRLALFALSLCSLSLLLSTVDGLAVNFGRDRAIRAPTAMSQRASMKTLYNRLSALKPGCGILQLPIVHYPYEQPGFPLYRLLVPGLYSDKFRWSSGATQDSKGWDLLQPFRKMQDHLDPNLYSQAWSHGFCAVLIDTVAWKAGNAFVPYTGYIPTPPIPYDKFLKLVPTNENPTVSDIQTPYGNYVEISPSQSLK